MYRKRLVYFTFLLLVTSLVQSESMAQQVEKNFELGEVIRVAAAYQAMPYLSFQTQVVITDSSYRCCDDGNTQPVGDTLQGAYRLHEGRFWALIDSVEYVQGFMYNLALYHQEKLVAVGKPRLDNGIMQLSVLDSAFQQAHVKSMRITEPTSNTRLFVIEFNSESPYSRYEMEYSKSDYLVRQVTYYVKNGYVRENETTGTAKISTTFFNYSSTAFSPDYFLEEKYIYKDREGFKTRQAYTGYQIITTDDDL